MQMSHKAGEGSRVCINKWHLKNNIRAVLCTCESFASNHCVLNSVPRVPQMLGQFTPRQKPRHSLQDNRERIVNKEGVEKQKAVILPHV